MTTYCEMVEAFEKAGFPKSGVISFLPVVTKDYGNGINNSEGSNRYPVVILESHKPPKGAMQ